MAWIRKNWLWVALALGAGISVFVSFYMVSWMDNRNTDLFTFWWAGRLLVHGGNPYDTAQWLEGFRIFQLDLVPNPTFLYPLPTALLFVPLSYAPLVPALTIWLALSTFMLMTSLLLALFSTGGFRSWKFFPFFLIGMIFSRPVVLLYLSGQVTGLFLLLLATTIYLWSKGKWTWGSLPLAFLMLKPSIGALILAFLGLWLLLRRKFASIAVIAGGLLFLLVAGLAVDPHWVAEFWAIGTGKVASVSYMTPTVWGISSLVCSENIPCASATGWLSAVLVLGVFSWLVWRGGRDISPLRLAGLVSTAALLVTPYTWTYDQVLLFLPLADLMITLERKGVRFLYISFLPLAVDALYLILQLLSVKMDLEILNVIAPLIVLGAYALQRPARLSKVLTAPAG